MQPIMRPLYDTRATVDVLLAVARELGGEVAQALPWPNEVDFVQETVQTLNDGSMSAEAFWSAVAPPWWYLVGDGELQSPSASGGFGAPLAWLRRPTVASRQSIPTICSLTPPSPFLMGEGRTSRGCKRRPTP